MNVKQHSRTCENEAWLQKVTVCTNRKGELTFWLSVALRPTKTVGLLGTGAQDVHLDFHTAPEL